MNCDGIFFEECAADHDPSIRQYGDISAQKRRYEYHFLELSRGNLHCDLQLLKLTETDQFIMELANLSSLGNEKFNSFGLLP
ncbi:hypothetical protein PEL8287_00711 [Roseovarius litorisediminis]|uniref:Uncharacterized protein n=1 Tax=Roseovarius litorisediminis TaxID=1312363 RepID=A0A1Y5RHW6_9RHOB|nr:hypothetical protein PEL8287_00711 [Roseovarius litorisediminis]